MFVAALGPHLLGLPTVPTGFVPDEDQGYFIIISPGAAGASLEYTGDIAKQAEQILGKDPGGRGRLRGHRLQLRRRGAEPGADLFISLKDFDERQGDEHSAEAVVGAVVGQLGGITGAVVIPFLPPAIHGLARFGGFQFECSTRQAATIERLAAATRQLTGGEPVAGAAGCSRSFTADDPQLLVEIDREKAEEPRDCRSREVTDALQVFLGSRYVNDFDFNNRAYRVYVQADQRFRADPAALKQFYVRSAPVRDGAARERRECSRDDGAAGDQPLQPVPVSINGAAAGLSVPDRRSKRCRQSPRDGFRREWALRGPAVTRRE